MKINAAEKAVLAAVLQNPKRVLVLDNADPFATCFCIDGVVGYCIPHDRVWLDAEKMGTHVNFHNVCSVLAEAHNRLTMTDHLVSDSGRLLRRFESWEGAHVWAEEALLKNFEFPSFYQERPLGPILVMERDAVSGEEYKAGIVMPAKLEDREE